uniref:G-protein coupled receptors family 1 profile domain-containing protein n=1 Tax=Colobus angolensis palliatus TaxID=336983 RepID=A0A2K5IN74_COLAP
MANVTLVTGFLLTGFSNVQKLQILYGVLFLLIYLAALMGNLLIVTLTTLHVKLQTPMYFFLKNLSFLDVFLVSVPIPKFIVNNLTHDNSISILGCGEIFLLTTMSCGRHVAICCPCTTSVSWAIGGLFGTVYTAGTFSMPFCGSSVIPQFFCDVPSLLRISCSETLMVIYAGFGVGACLSSSCFICIVISYIYIFSTVLKIPTTKGQSKAFSTCLPHLIVFTVFIITAYFVYLKPPSNSPSVIDRLFSVICTVMPPLFNPVIYSLQNDDMKRALIRLLQNTHGQEAYFF